MDKVFIIAEAGVNHNGDFYIAEKLIDVAAEAGVDAVKFQTFVPENLASSYAEKATYQKKSTGVDESQLEMLRKLELKREWHVDLMRHAKNKNLVFLSSAFDMDSIDFLTSLEMPFYKIPSGEITNLLYLKKIGTLGKPVILSTGMSTMEEIGAAVKVLRDCGCQKVFALHCNTQYPTQYEDVNLKAMLTIGETLRVETGYSDHTLGIEVPIAAVALGAKIIEKHFTLNRMMEGPDHKASLEPKELKEMVKAIRNIEKALGDGEKKVSTSERENITIARKSIIASRRIKMGEFFTEDNITIKRPGTGISPMRWYEVLGQRAARDFDEDELIEL